MFENVTASFGLSLLTLLFFAVALYQPDRPNSKTSKTKPSSTTQTTETKPTATTPPQPLSATELPPTNVKSAVEPPQSPELGENLVMTANEPAKPERSTSLSEPSPNVSTPPPVVPPEPKLVEPPKVDAPQAPLPSTSEPVSPISTKPEAEPENIVKEPPTVPQPTPAPPPEPVFDPTVRREAMTQVRSGETLATFAKRVYGPSYDPVDVWKSNRDLLETATTPLVSGTMLRTP